MLQITDEGMKLIRAALASADEAQRQRIIEQRRIASYKPQRLRRERQESIQHRILGVMRTWKTSWFEFEGVCRSGLRSELCLEGWSWRDADATAAEIVERCLKLMGAVRPTWDQGQPEWGDNSLTIRTRCAHTPCGKPIPNDRIDNGRLKYCSKECNAAATFARAQASGERRTRAEWKAHVAARRLSTCLHCSGTFHAENKKQLYCSMVCAKTDRRTVKPRPCPNCGTEFKPRSDHTKFCSGSCFTEYADKKKNRVECPTCSKVFIGRPNSKYCSRECSVAAKPPSIPEVSCQHCSTIFRPRNRFKPRVFCSKPCADAGRTGRPRAGFLRCEEIS